MHHSISNRHCITTCLLNPTCKIQFYEQQTYTVEPFLQCCPSSGWWRCCLVGLTQRWWSLPHTLMKNKYMKESKDSNSSWSWGAGVHPSMYQARMVMITYFNLILRNFLPMDELYTYVSSAVCLLTGRKKCDSSKISINSLWSQEHTCCLNWVAALVVEWRWEGHVSTGWTAVLNSRKQLGEPHPQSVITTHTHTKSDLRVQ